MINQEVAQILFEIGIMLELQEILFKPEAYKKAADGLENLEEDVFDIYRKEGIKGLEKIDGVGKNIALSIEEFIKKGKIKYHKELKKEFPIDFKELMKVEGLGIKKIKKLWEELKIRNLKDLEKAVKKNKIAPIFGFGEKTEKNILESIRFLKQGQGRFILRDISSEIEKVETELKKIKEIINFSIAGSVRRRKETIGDVDFLVSIKDISDKEIIEKIMNTFTTMENVVKVIVRGETKSSIKIGKNLNMDLRLVEENSFGAALQYFTGSKDHNIALRKIAMKKGYKLNEYGLFKGEKRIGGATEDGIYKKLGMSFIPPEIRENHGEIELAIKKKLPSFIKIEDIRGDLHCHTSWNGGDNSIEEMAEEAMKLGYMYLGISDHTKSLKIENGLDEKKLLEQKKEINKLNKNFVKNKINFKVLQGSEVDILKDGSLDINDNVLSVLDYVSVSVHSSFKMDKEEMTNRIIKALNNPYVKILNHPTGAVIGRREGYEVDMDRIFEVAKKNNIALEINSYRGDLSSYLAKLAKKNGIKLTISSDAHNKRELKNIQFGVYQARRAWLTKKDILNTYEKI
jgi:DNA polymerase (family 10)